MLYNSKGMVFALECILFIYFKLKNDLLKQLYSCLEPSNLLSEFSTVEIPTNLRSLLPTWGQAPFAMHLRGGRFL